MTLTQEYIGTLAIVACAQCGVAFGLPERMEQDRRRDHKDFFCPSGHSNYYPGESDLEAERRRRKAAEAREVHLGDQLEAERRSKAALKGHLTRARNKIAAGICPAPDCGMHFSNVREHMRHRHPDFHLIDPETGKAAEL